MKSTLISKGFLCLCASLMGPILVAQTPLTDATTTSTAITLSSGTNGANVVDNAVNTYVNLSSSGTCRIDLGSAKTIKGYALTNTIETGFNPSNWRIEASNSANSGYVTLDTRSGNSWEQQGSRKFFNLTNTTAYRYYRIVNTASSQQMYLAEAELFEDFSISGSVFLDNNLNNKKEATELPVIGTKVWLKSLSAVNPVATRTTGLTGAYQFSGSELDGLEIFTVTAKPSLNLQPRTEPMPQSGLSFPSLAADGSYLFSNVLANQYGMGGAINFGFLPPTTTAAAAQLLEYPNLITNAANGTFGVSDTSDNAFLKNHPNTKYFSLTNSHPELYSNVMGYTTGTNYTYQSGSYGSSGFLWDEGKYLVTDFLGTVFLETAGPNLGLKGIMNNMSYGWRVSTGATTGAWNDRFLAVNGSSKLDSSMNAVIFADTVTLAAGNTYSMGFFGKSANKWQQGASVAKPSVVKYFVKRLSTGDTVAMGSITVEPTTSDATDSVNFGWNKAYTDFIAQYNGDYGVYFLVTSSDIAGNDAYFDNFFLKKSSYKISGRIFNDANGLTNDLVDGTLISSLTNNQLYAYLLDPSDNHILAQSTVQADGSYVLFAPEYGSYNVAVSTKKQMNGSVFSAIITDNWSFTGSNTGIGNLIGQLLNTLASKVGVTPLSILTDITEVNFGFQRLPMSYNRTKNISGAPVKGTAYSLSDLPLQGSDMEDNSGVQANWNNRAAVINTLPTNGFILKYNGTVVQVGDTVYNYNPALLSVTPGNNTPAGTLQTVFTYSAVDAAKQSSTAPATYTVNFTQPLPVELISFTATVNNECAVILEWASAEEKNFRHFVVERSENGRDFISIATIVATGSYSDYTYKDATAASGKSYYRLKLVDHDNSIAYSGVRTAVLSCNNKLQVFPTQTQDLVQVQGTQAGSVIRVMDMSGRVLMQETAKGATTQISLANLAAAQYLIGIIRDGHAEWVKVIKQ
ncbi:hypothetical protein D3C72_454180 [compost metagenome]